MIEKKEEYVARLYDELFTPHHEFCMGLNWLSEEALASDASNRFEQMWKIYLALMTKVGAEMFGSDVYCARHWDPFRTHLRMRLYRAGCTVSSYAMLTSACDGTIAITVSRMGNGQSPCKCLKMVGPNKQVEGHHFIMRWESFP